MKVHITPTPIGLKCLEWAKKNTAVDFSEIDECEVFFSVLYNKLVQKEFIEKRRCYNFHGGILPQYRGSGTLNFAILNGEKESGITLHEIDERIDHGKIIDTQTFPIGEKDTTQDLFVKTEAAILELFKKWFMKILLNAYPREIQDEQRAKLYTRADLQKARDLTRFARAFHTEGYEQAYYFNSRGEKIYLKW